MDFLRLATKYVSTIEDAGWREVPEQPHPPDPEPDANIPEAQRARARLAQAVALRDMQASWHRAGRQVVSPAEPRLQEVGAGRPGPSLRWLASCGGSTAERARAAEQLALEDLLGRPRRPHAPLRSI